MNIREELLQDLYDMVSNEELCPDMQIAFTKMMNMCELNFPKEKEDEVMSGLCELEHRAFMAGANMVLDFITGREVS